MKALRIILIILGILVAATLIVPLFTPATAEVQAEIDIVLEPAKIFSHVASFNKREMWDPWVTNDSTTKVKIDSKAGYVGSTYAWEGEKLGSGRMEVISVTANKYIRSSLWFGDVEIPSLVEWTFEPHGDSTHVVWSFSQETTYPVGRLGMIFGKIFLKQSFKSGLANLKEYLETVPLPISTQGTITIATQQPIVCMVAAGAGTMETIGEQLGTLYGKIMKEVGAQQLNVVGAPFVHYQDFDESTGSSNYLAGIPVLKTGKTSGDVYPMTYSEMQVVKVIHNGPYDEFATSYDLLDQYILLHSLRVTGEAFEFYLNDPEREPDPAKWHTLIALPIIP